MLINYNKLANGSFESDSDKYFSYCGGEKTASELEYNMPRIQSLEH